MKVTPAATPAGILVVDKPRGMTSMQVCRIVKRRLINGGAPKRVKVGHGGTLDPLATGVLVVLVGKATKLCGRVMAGRKRYVADVDLLHRSTTDDAEGELTEVSVERAPSREEVEAALRAFVGTVMQRPPVYSAIKVGGRRAYDVARREEAKRRRDEETEWGRDEGTEARRHEGGREKGQRDEGTEGQREEGTEGQRDRGTSGLPVLAARPVVIYAIGVVEYAWPRAVLEISCGKGTYIRSIARDLGDALGTGGMLTGLRRTEVAPFLIEQAVGIDEVPDPLKAGDLREVEMPAR